MRRCRPRARRARRRAGGGGPGRWPPPSPGGAPGRGRGRPAGSSPPAWARRGGGSRGRDDRARGRRRRAPPPRDPAPASPAGAARRRPAPRGRRPRGSRGPCAAAARRTPGARRCPSTGAGPGRAGSGRPRSRRDRRRGLRGRRRAQVPPFGPAEQAGREHARGRHGTASWTVLGGVPARTEPHTWDATSSSLHATRPPPGAGVSRQVVTPLTLKARTPLQMPGGTVAEAYIVDAVRTPIGTRKGALADVHPADLGAHALTALMERTGIDPGAVEDVLMGCVSQLGPQA